MNVGLIVVTGFLLFFDRKNGMKLHSMWYLKGFKSLKFNCVNTAETL